MERYGPDRPEGDDRPQSQHDPLAYWDDIPSQTRDVRNNLLRGYAARNTSDAFRSVDSGQLLEDLVVLAGLTIRGLFLLVSWPIRWSWRRSRRSKDAR